MLDMLKGVFSKLFVSPLLLAVIFSFSSTCAIAQQKKIPKEPFQIIDAVTGKLIAQVLIIPIYESFQGISTMLGEGPGSGTYQTYLDKPFIYRTGEPFILKVPKPSGLALSGLLFIGIGRSVEGILVLAPKYSPKLVTDLWSTGEERKLQLKPISDVQWSKLLEILSPLTKDSYLVGNNCPSFCYLVGHCWSPTGSCSIKIKYNRKEREIVQSFLQQTTIQTK